MQLDLSTLEIKILLRCSKELMSRSIFSQLYRQDGKTIKEKAITNLIEKGYIIQKALPRLGSTKTPVFYEITDEGKTWVDNYIKYYPK